MSTPTVAKDLEACREACFRAFSAGQFADAIKQARRAMVLLAMVPDTEIRQLSSVTWDRKAMQAVIEEIQEAKHDAAVAGASTDRRGWMESIPVKYVRDA